MTENEKKAYVAQALIQQAGTLVEFWTEQTGCEEITATEARVMLARWLGRLPGNSWDLRLGLPPQQ